MFGQGQRRCGQRPAAWSETGHQRGPHSRAQFWPLSFARSKALARVDQLCIGCMLTAREIGLNFYLSKVALWSVAFNGWSCRSESLLISSTILKAAGKKKIT